MPLLTIIAGPNGSGKSTLTQGCDFDGRERLLDPDSVARALNPLNPAVAAMAAGREVLKKTADYLDSRLSFAVETTLSGAGNIELISAARSRGYEVHLVYIAVDTPERSVSRVSAGHLEGAILSQKPISADAIYAPWPTRHVRCGSRTLPPFMTTLPVKPVLF